VEDPVNLLCVNASMEWSINTGYSDAGVIREINGSCGVFEGR
ncbi:hypothetical protein AVEN_89716-1, partial [Araneus ventricosus]